MTDHSFSRICRHRFLLTALFTCFFLAAGDPAIGQTDTLVTVILEDLVVSEAQAITQQTPIANFRGDVFIANIEPGPNGDVDGIDLLTVVRKGTRISDGSWEWQSSVIENRTAYDKWHTPPAIAVDKSGYIHVAYNMHNMPWQYSVSKDTRSIEKFRFRGQKLSDDELDMVFNKNRTPFKTHGSAAIPGNQITYPAFYYDRSGELYITYRFAAKPARPFKDRAMSSAIASYSVEDEQWTALGVEVPQEKGDYKRQWLRSNTIPSAIAMQQGWTSYHPRLAFDIDNGLHVLWFWRKGIAGAELERPCYMYSPDGNDFFYADGSPAVLPVGPDDCESSHLAKNSAYFGNGNTAVDDSTAFYAILSPTGVSRELLTVRNGVVSSERSPENASEIFLDHQGVLWAVADGPVILSRHPGQTDWDVIFRAADDNMCFPRASLNRARTTAYIHMLNCRRASVSVYRLSLQDD